MPLPHLQQIIQYYVLIRSFEDDCASRIKEIANKITKQLQRKKLSDDDLISLTHVLESLADCNLDSEFKETALQFLENTFLNQVEELEIQEPILKLIKTIIMYDSRCRHHKLIINSLSKQLSLHNTRRIHLICEKITERQFLLLIDIYDLLEISPNQSENKPFLDSLKKLITDIIKVRIDDKYIFNSESN